LILALLPFHAFVSTWGGAALGPLEVWKSWKEILLLVCLGVSAVYLYRQGRLKAFVSDKLVWLIFGYAGLHLLLWLIFRPERDAAMAGLLINLRFLGMFLLSLVVLTFVRPRQLWQAALIVVVAGGTTVLTFAALQLTLLPADFLRHFGYGAHTIAPVTTLDDNHAIIRLQSTLRGPNPLGQYLILIAVLLLPVLRSARKQVIAFWLGMTAIILFYTYSRSAWIGVAAAVGTFAALQLTRIRKPGRLFWISGGVVAALSIVVLLALPHSSFVQNAILHNKQGDSDAGSTVEHFNAAQRSLRHIAEHPFGQGPGSAGPASFYGAQPNIPENYFLQLTEELGVVGIALFVAINGVVVARLWRVRQDVWAAAWLAAFVGISVVNLFLHGWADETTAMMWWALAAVLLHSTPIHTKE